MSNPFGPDSDDEDVIKSNNSDNNTDNNLDTTRIKLGKQTGSKEAG